MSASVNVYTTRTFGLYYKQETAIKPLFAYGQAAGLRFTLLVIASIGLMTLDQRENLLSDVRSAFSILVYPIQYAVSFPTTASHWMEDSVTSNQNLLESNKKLQTQNIFLKSQMQKFISLEIENMRLRRLLDASDQIEERVLAAELISIDLDPFKHQVLINKGTRHEVYEGQPLLDADGVYGQVVHAMPITSSVMLITDPSHALPVQVNRTGVRAIASGTGILNQLKLLHIPNNADLKTGDILVTSGLGGVFPAGYPVAKVVSFEPDTTQPYATVHAIPMASLDRSAEVLLVWKKKTLLTQKQGNPPPDTKKQTQAN